MRDFPRPDAITSEEFTEAKKLWLNPKNDAYDFHEILGWSYQEFKAYMKNKSK